MLILGFREESYTLGSVTGNGHVKYMASPFFEPTCANCMVGSYALFSVCLYPVCTGPKIGEMTTTAESPFPSVL